MKRKILYFVFLLVCCLMIDAKPIYASKEEELTLDVDTSNNESYDSIQGNFKGFDFFDEKNIEKIESQNKQKQETLIQRQNLIFTTTTTRSNEYQDVQNKVFETPINVSVKQLTITTIHIYPYICMGVILGCIFILGLYMYYQKRMERRLAQDDEINYQYIQ